MTPYYDIGIFKGTLDPSRIAVVRGIKLARRFVKMKLRRRHLVAIVAPLILASWGTAFAANCSNGQALYRKQVGGVFVGCAQSSCHGTNPATNMNNIQSGGGSPANIENALA